MNSVSDASVAGQLERVLATYLPGTQVHDHMPLTAQGLDSLAMVQLINDLEEAFAVHVDAAAIDAGVLLTPASILAFVTTQSTPTRRAP